MQTLPLLTRATDDGVTFAMTPRALLRPLGGYLSDRCGPRGVTSYRIGLWPFAGLTFMLGCAMGVGKASVYKYIPDCFPNDVGAVGGVVGMLPLLGLTASSLLWLHVVVLRLPAASPLLDGEGRLPARYPATSPL